MEKNKTQIEIHYPYSNSSFNPIFKNFKKEKGDFGGIEYFSMKSRKSQSLSTNYDDKKDNETNEIISLKKVEIKLNDNKKSNLNINRIKNFENKIENEKKNNENIILYDKISLDNNKKINYKNNNPNIYSKENNKKQKLESIGKLNSFPPIIPDLFNNMYILSNNRFCNFFNSKFDIKLNTNIIPNNFYNHLMIKYNCSKNKIYFSYSIKNRIKSKLLTIIFYQPVKSKE